MGSLLPTGPDSKGAASYALEREEHRVQHKNLNQDFKTSLRVRLQQAKTAMLLGEYSFLSREELCDKQDKLGRT